MNLEQKLAAALWDQRCLFWRVLLGTAPPDWKLLEDLHASICAAEARYRQVHIDSRQSQLQSAWKYALMGSAPNWPSLERIDAELAALEQQSAPCEPPAEDDL
ncbi:MAG TPA: hypothetical protein VMS96_05690 [Terriglobales bacterium]|nr:hypothetical protein [Terriglobales bacterium]